MIRFRRECSIILAVGFICFFLFSCGGSVTRYNPGPSAVPGSLSVAATGDGQVTLVWDEAANAAAYAVYYSTTQGVPKTSGTKFGSTTGTSAIVTGLENDKRYFFIVTSVNSIGESAASNEVSATPSAKGSFNQDDLTGTWYFNVLNAGSNAGWMRGKLTVDAAGAVAFNSFIDSSGGTSPPAGLFPALFLDSTGRVRDTDSGDPVFQGFMATRRNMIVGTSSPTSTSRSLAVLQKQVTGVTFSNDGDIKGFGNSAGGARRFIYTQVSSGTLQEWQFAMGQIGQDRGIQYSAFISPSSPATPGAKATSLSINEDGIVSEVRGSATPQPDVVIPAGVMSSDKSIIVGTATNDGGGAGKYVLRIYQMINIVPNDANAFSLADLAGDYRVERLLVGSSALWASGELSINASGLGNYSSYIDSVGGTTPPTPFTLAISSDGVLTDALAASLHGKLSYFKDMLAYTRTESNGLFSISIGVK